MVWDEEMTVSGGSDSEGGRRPRPRNPFAKSEPPQTQPGGGTGHPPAGPQPPLGPAGSAGPVSGDGAAADDPEPQFGRDEIEVDGTRVSVAAMAVWDVAPEPYEPLPLQVKLVAAEGGQWRALISWPPWTGPGIAVYRVVAADGAPPASMAESVEATLAVTTATSIADSSSVNRPTSGSRYYEVWAYTGPDIATAVVTPPHMHAGCDDRAYVLWPPLGVAVAPQGSQLVVSWDALPDQRFRWAKRTKSEIRRNRPSSADGEDIATRGLVDPEVVPGEEYVYFLYAGVRWEDQTEWCATPAIQRASLPVRLAAVMDLVAEPVSDSIVNLSWTTLPVGQVDVYFSQQAPPADIQSAGQVVFDELGKYPYNLDLSTPIRNPVREDAGRSNMLNVDVSSDSSAVFFTPVTRHGRQARPGRSLRWLRADPPSDLVVIDRVDQVLIAFRWPRGAARVDLWRTPVDSAPPDPARAPQPFASLGREDYDAFGGFLLARDLRFSSGPCALHLAGYSQHSGSGKHSAVATVRGVFPVLVEYTFEVERKSTLLGARQRNRLLLRSAEQLTAGFTLVWSQTAFPLSRSDGQGFGSWELTLQARTPLAVDLPRDLPDTGFIRLIADPLHEPPIAVIDPPPSYLRLGNA